MITTYDVVASEWVAPPKVAKGKENKKPESDDGEDTDDSLMNKVKGKSGKIKTFGPLFEARFHRIILGESLIYYAQFRA